MKKHSFKTVLLCVISYHGTFYLLLLIIRIEDHIDEGVSEYLVGLKSTESKDIKSYSLKNLISEAEDLTKIYFECKNIKYIVENKVSTIICGGISPNAMQTLFDAGVKVIPGASGDVNVAISSLI